MPPLRQGILWWPQPSPWHQNCWTENPRKIKEGHLKPLRRGPSRTWLLTRTNMSQMQHIWAMAMESVHKSASPIHSWEQCSPMRAILGFGTDWAMTETTEASWWFCMYLRTSVAICRARMFGYNGLFEPRSQTSMWTRTCTHTHTHRFVCDSPWLRQHPLSVRCSPTNKQANKQKTRSTFVLHVHAVQ